MDTVDVREGYGTWAATYDETADPRLDLDLLGRLQTVRWDQAAVVADLACGTGRTGAWLREQGAASDGLHGVDATPEMLTRARVRGEHDRLVEASVTETGLTAGAYDLVVVAFVDAHLPSVRPLYREARRLLAPGAAFVLAGVHPFLVLAGGTPREFATPDGRTVAVETHAHLLSAHLDAAQAAGFALLELREAVAEADWGDPWARWAGLPVSLAAVWR